MTLYSKPRLEKLISAYDCHEIIHPWSESCVEGSLKIVISTMKGGLKFFSVMYAAHILFRILTKKKIDYNKEAKGFTRSILFVSAYAFLFTGTNCILRKFLGKFYTCTTFMLVPILIGGTVFIESQGRLNLNVTTFLTAVLEGFYRSLQNHGTIKCSRLHETLVFMVLNGTLMYTLRAQKENGEKSDNPWFFVPMKIKDTIHEGIQKDCPHEGLCTRSLQMDLMKFGGIALLISTLKHVAQHFKDSSRLVSGYFKWNNWKIVSFVTLYIGIFKIVGCYLCKTRGDSLQNTFIAGLLGGLSYAVSPNITLLCSVFTALLKVKGKQAREKFNLPKLPYMEITFIFANYYTLYLRAFDKNSCPRYVSNMLDVITSYKCEEVCKQIKKVLDGNSLRRIEMF